MSKWVKIKVKKCLVKNAEYQAFYNSYVSWAIQFLKADGLQLGKFPAMATFEWYDILNLCIPSGD